MSIASEITRINTNIENAYSACNNKGATMPVTQNSDNLPACINSIPTGGGTADATAVAGDILVGKTAYVSTGKVTGTLPNYWNTTKKSSGTISTYLTAIPLLDTSEYTSLSYFFNSMKYLKNIPLLNTSNVTNMNSVFGWCSSLEELPLWDTSKVTDMAGYLYNCTSLTEFPAYDTSNVTTMSSMITGCSGMINVSGLNAQKVVNVAYILRETRNVKNLGGFINLGQGYLTTTTSNYNNYKLDLSTANKLTKTSLMNVINNLYDIATKGCNVQTLQLGATNIAKLTATEIAIATAKGWNVA